MTKEEFKAYFKVGDIVTSWATDKKVRITAIGETRFLYWDDYRQKEGVGTMSPVGIGWRLVK